MPEERPSFGGNRGVDAEVTMSFMCSSSKRDEIRAAATKEGIAISELIRKAIDEHIGGIR